MFDDDDPLLARVRELAAAFPGANEKVLSGDVRGEPASEVGEGGEHRAEREAPFGEVVLDAWGDLGVHRATDQSRGLEVAQPVGERLGADPDQRRAQLAESTR